MGPAWLAGGAAVWFQLRSSPDDTSRIWSWRRRANPQGWRDLPAHLMTEWRLEPVGLQLPPCPASLCLWRGSLSVGPVPTARRGEVGCKRVWGFCGTFYIYTHTHTHNHIKAKGSILSKGHGKKWVSSSSHRNQNLSKVLYRPAFTNCI